MNAHAATDVTPAEGKSFSRYVPTGVRVVLGLGFFVSGVFGLLVAFGAMPMPQPPQAPPENMAAFMTGMMKSGYLFPLIKLTEALMGALLLANRFVPLALTILAPVLVNILAFHAFLAPSGIVPGLVLAALEVYLAYAYRESFRGVLSARAKATP
jgi:hypothetical protein